MVSMVMKVVLCCTLHVLLGVLCAGGPVYFNIWPLGETSCGYDIERNKDAIQPRVDSCWLELGSQHPSLSYRSLLLDGSTFLDLEPRAILSKDFTIKLNIKPSRLSGTILHLKFECPDTSRECLRSTKLFLRSDGSIGVNGHVGIAKEGMFKKLSIQVGKWNYLGIQVEEGSGCKMVISQEIDGTHIDEDDFELSNNKDCKYERRNPELRIGATWDETEGFEGEVTCASLLDGKESEIGESLSKCTDTTLSWPPASAMNFKSPPVHVFPLYNKNAGYDIITSAFLGLDPSHKDLRWDLSPVPALTHGSLRMDGSPLSTLDLRLSGQLLQQDFTLAFYVRPASGTHGTLAQARRAPDSTAEVAQLSIAFNQSHVTASFQDGGSDVCGEVSTSRSSWEDMTWGVVGVGRRGSSIFVVCGDGMETAGLSCSSGGSGDLLLRLGGSLDSEAEGFHGNIACVAVFNVSIISAYLLKIIIVENNGPIVMDPIPGTMATTETFYRFSLVQTQAEPSTSLLPVLSGPQLGWGSAFPARSLAACAKECGLSPHCRSFSLSKVQGSGKGGQCQLYDFLTGEFLVESPHTNYYSMTSREPLRL